MSQGGSLRDTISRAGGRIVCAILGAPLSLPLLARALQRNDFELLKKVSGSEAFRKKRPADPQQVVELLGEASSTAASPSNEVEADGSVGDGNLSPDHTALKLLLEADDAAVLRNLYGAGSATLKRLMLADDGKRLKALLNADDGAVLRSTFGTSSNTLKSLMLADDAKRLKALLNADNAAVLRSLYGGGSEALKSLLLEDDAKRLLHLLFANRFEVLENLFRTSGKGALRHLMLMDGSRLVREALIETGDRALYELLFDHQFIDHIARLPRTRAHVHLEEAWDELEPVVDAAVGLNGHLAEQRQLLRNEEKVWEHLMNVVAVDDAARLRGGTLRFPDRGALWTLIHEILINEDYYADLQSVKPRILDCGAHFGMSLYFFVTQYPHARVTAFEPDPANFKILSENIAGNGFNNVELLPYALCAEGGVRTLYRSDKFSMASSLSDRREHFGESLSPVEVQCRRLSPYLREPVDFLKLDIEGEEDQVLAECADVLKNVHYLFCEYHQGEGLSGDRLAKILTLLDNAGFDVHVGKSHGFQERTKRRPMTFVDGTYSAVIYAKNRNWKPAPATAEAT